MLHKLHPFILELALSKPQVAKLTLLIQHDILSLCLSWNACIAPHTTTTYKSQNI